MHQIEAAEMLILLLLLLSPINSQSSFNDDVLGLILFKAGITNDPLSRLTSWKEEDDNPCAWLGVKCDPITNRVSQLNLDGFSLSGHLGRTSFIMLNSLSVLSLSGNNFTGNITPFLPITLKLIDLSHNAFTGIIPHYLFQQCCFSLKHISLANNYLTGPIPTSLLACTNLEKLDFSNNFFNGEIPTGIDSLYQLREFNLSANRFMGCLPQNIGNSFMSLESLDFSGNYFTGVLPFSINKLGRCRFLDFSANSFTGELPDWIGDMTSLEFLGLSRNNFTGVLPDSVGNLHSLKVLNLSRNQFGGGGLPDSFRNCFNLRVLDVGHNLFYGDLPLGGFLNLPLETFSVSANSFGGSLDFPRSFVSSYQTLRVLDLSYNAFSGEIPPGVGNFSRLLVLNVSGNSLNGEIPATVGDLNNSYVVDMSHNQLTGPIPSEIGGALSLQELRLEGNFLNGTIPSDIGNCSSLTSLILSRNNLTGTVPDAVARLTNLEAVDFSFNNLSGSLPKELMNLSHLVTFNVSFNRIEGELPVGGFFDSIPTTSVNGNPSLCGSIVNRSCPAVHPKPLVLNPNSSDTNHGPLPNFHHKRIILSISSLVAISAAVFIALGVITVCILNMHARTSMAQSAAAAAFTFSGGDEYSPSQDKEANYGKLVMFTGDADFVAGAQSLLNKNCEIGRGGFGAVYKTKIRDGRSVAIKKLNTTCLVKCQQDFEEEVKELGKMRHQNLVMVEGYYWTPSLQLLINEYVSGGSLYKHLHEGESISCLTWQQRFKIIHGTAKGIAHLHQMNVIHYDMKSSNVLIDANGDTKVGDFGLARLLPALDRYILSSKIQSALGYMAPEFACQTVKITEKCDVYGFGILILEILTGKRPVEYMEDDVVVLCDTVRGAVDEGRVEECIDHRLEGRYPIEEAIPVVKLGLVCVSQVPSNRPDMEEVIRILELIQTPVESQEELE